MKPIVAIIVFFSLMVPSLFLGYANYVTAKEHIIEDVNQALVKTVLLSHPERITADTLRVFKSNLQIGQLKETAYLSLCTDEPSKVSFCSDTVSFRTAYERLYIRAYPNCSKATIFSLSEQTVPSTLLAASMVIGLLIGYLIGGKSEHFEKHAKLKASMVESPPEKVKVLDDFESDSYGWQGNFKQVPGGVNGGQCGRFLVDFAQDSFIGKMFPLSLYVYDSEYDRIEFDFKIEPLSGSFDRWFVLHLGDNTGTTRNYPTMHMQNYPVREELFQENPRSTFALFRLDDKGETGRSRTTKREFLFAKDKFLWVRDSFRPSAGEPFAAGPVWQIGELTGKQGDHWYDTRVESNLLFFFPKKPYGTLELISNPSPKEFEAGFKKQYPALLTYCVSGEKPEREYVFDTILLPHDGKGDAGKLAESIKVLYDKDNVTLIQVGEDWMLRNPEGKNFKFGELATNSRILYLERKDGKIITKEEYK